MNKNGVFRATWFVLLAGAGFSALPGYAATDAPSCTAEQLNLRLDDGDGEFDGASHAGVRVVLKNTGDTACSLPARPDVRFEDVLHHALPTSLQTPAGMHPGPVLLPVEVAPGAEVGNALRWVSNGVFPTSRCYRPAFLSVSLDQGELTTRFAGRLCGPLGQKVSYTESLLQ